jgi:hypothetical protein
MFVTHVNGHCVKKLVQTPSCHLLTCIDFSKENIIQYCGTWYGSNHGGFVTMFVNPTYLHIYDNESNDEEANKDHSE